MSNEKGTNRSTIGKIGGHAVDGEGKTNTGPAFEAAMARFEKQIAGQEGS